MYLFVSFLHISVHVCLSNLKEKLKSFEAKFMYVASTICIQVATSDAIYWNNNNNKNNIFP